MRTLDTHRVLDFQGASQLVNAALDGVDGLVHQLDALLLVQRDRGHNVRRCRNKVDLQRCNVALVKISVRGAFARYKAAQSGELR